MPTYNLMKYGDNYLKISESLWQHCRDELALDNNGNIADFADNTTDSINLLKK